MVTVALTRTIESVVVAGTRKVALALVLAGALLLCHGVFGAAHQLHHTLGPASLHVAAHPSHDSHGAHDANAGERPDGGGKGYPASSAYVAALAAILLGAVVAALLGGTRFWVRTGATLAPRLRPSFPKLALARGSPAPVSQVFRL